MRDALAFYRATAREGAPMLFAFPAVLIGALLLEIVR